MRKIITLILAATLIVCSLAACGGTNDTPQTSDASATVSAEEVATEASQPGGEQAETAPAVAWEDTIVKVAISVDPAIFGPFQTTNKGRKEVLPEIYECLAMQQGVGGEIKGVLAKDWKAVDGEENTYEVEIYDYITDSEGNEITADDIIYSYTDAGFDDFKRYLGKMDSIEKIDDYKVKIKMKSSSIGAFENIITRVYVIDEDAFKADSEVMASNPVGSGPYDLVDYVAGSKVTLEAREDYWQKDESLLVENQFQNVKTIEFQVIPEAAQQSIALETGEVDVVNGMSASAVDRFEGNSDYVVDSVLGNNVRTIIFNCNSGACSDVRVRQAICYAIDNEEMMQGILDGAGAAAFCAANETSVDVPDSWNDGTYYPKDIDKAKALLKEAGYENGLTIKLLTFTGETESDIANVIYAYLSEIGINVEINQYEEALVKTYQRDYSAFDILILQRFANNTYVTTNWYEKLSKTTWDDGLNYCGIADEKLEKLLDEANDVSTHNEETVEALRDYIDDNALLYGMFSSYNYTVHNNNIIDTCLDLDYWLIPGCCTYSWN